MSRARKSLKNIDLPGLRGLAMLARSLVNLWVALVRTAGFEPALPYGKRILSPQRLPFRHVRLPEPGDGRASQTIRR
jgi:hypothetical protein